MVLGVVTGTAMLVIGVYVPYVRDLSFDVREEFGDGDCGNPSLTGKGRMYTTEVSWPAEWWGTTVTGRMEVDNGRATFVADDGAEIAYSMMGGEGSIDRTGCSIPP
jgi:hypothetical protein